MFKTMAVGLGLFTLSLAGCLKVPVGNPETSRVDPQFTGYWLSES